MKKNYSVRHGIKHLRPSEAVRAGRRRARKGGQYLPSPTDKPPLAPCCWDAVMVGRSSRKEKGIEVIMVMVCICHDTPRGDPGHSAFTG